MNPAVFVFGESGRMGQEVKKIVEGSSHLDYVGGFSADKTDLKPSRSPDIIIDFSLPATLSKLCTFAEQESACVLSGTTGFQDSDFQKLKDLGQRVPTFWSANMSFGVYLMCQLTETLARYDRFYQFQVEETHHIHKVDKPSGTAIIVENAAKQSTDTLRPTISHREGEVFGIHRFIASSVNEQLEIRHEAHNRALFAQGAVDISQWLFKKDPGFYGMDDFFKTFE